MSQLEHKRAVVTGAASGIGRAIARKFVEEGAAVTLVDRNTDALQLAATELSAQRTDVGLCSADVSREAEVEEMMRVAMQQLGTVNVFVSAAGVSGRRSNLVDMELDEWQRMLSINLTSLFLCGRAAARHMVSNDGGSIVNITSQLSEVSTRDYCHYSTAKAGAAMLTKGMALDLAEKNVRVNAIGPGPTNTGMTRYETPENQARAAQIIERVPMRRWAQPDEIAGAAVFLASDAASFVTGATIIVDGGYLTI